MAFYLLPIADREALWWIINESRTAFPAHRRREAAALAVGDTLLLYTTRGCFRNPTRDRGRLIGIATVVEPPSDLDQPVRFGAREFPIGVGLAIDRLLPRGEGIELAPLIPDLWESFPKPRAWSARLRRALVPLAASDGRALERRVRRRSPSRENARQTYAPLA
jgi:hypothetical protein